MAPVVELSVAVYGMIDLNSLYTFSGLFIFVALVALINGRLTLAGLLLTVAGAGGLGVFWERWSQRAGDDVHVTAVLSGVRPTAAQFELLATHVPLLVLGIILLSVVAWRNQRAKGGAT